VYCKKARLLRVTGKEVRPVELGSFSLIEGAATDNAQTSQMCDQCQICDDDGCWDFTGDGDSGDE